MNADMINGSFELLGAAFLMLNVHKIHQDKELNGVHWTPTMFFAAWGLWNLYYYPSLEQWFSFYGGLLIVVVDVIWLLQVWYYSKFYVKPADTEHTIGDSVLKQTLDRIDE